MSIRLMHANMELSFRPRGSLVDQVSPDYSCSDDWGRGIGSGR